MQVRRQNVHELISFTFPTNLSWDLHYSGYCFTPAGAVRCKGFRHVPSLALASSSVTGYIRDKPFGCVCNTSATSSTSITIYIYPSVCILIKNVCIEIQTLLNSTYTRTHTNTHVCMHVYVFIYNAPTHTHTHRP
jgi:hypothetical protein